MVGYQSAEHLRREWERDPRCGNACVEKKQGSSVETLMSMPAAIYITTAKYFHLIARKGKVI